MGAYDGIASEARAVDGLVDPVNDLVVPADRPSKIVGAVPTLGLRPGKVGEGRACTSPSKYIVDSP